MASRLLLRVRYFPATASARKAVADYTKPIIIYTLDKRAGILEGFLLSTGGKGPPNWDLPFPGQGTPDPCAMFYWWGALASVTGAPQSLWRIEFPAAQETIVAVTAKPAGELTSSAVGGQRPAGSNRAEDASRCACERSVRFWQGDILGDKSVLFKYLNPSLIAVATLTPYVKRSGTLTVYLVDTIRVPLGRVASCNEVCGNGQRFLRFPPWAGHLY
jgi:hypothetical protein